MNRFVFGLALVMWLTPAVSMAKVTRLFILSGQSNMKGMDPDVAFTPAIKAAFPDDEIVVAKFAQSGQLIRMWDKQWKPPAGVEPAGQGRNGKHYDALIAVVKDAMKDKPAPASITFVWMQGEADANHKGYAELYADAFNRVIAQLETDLGRRDIDVVVGRLSDYGNNDPAQRPGWMAIRKIQEDIAHRPRSGWIDTDDLNGKADGLHYGKEGYRQLGERFAAKAIELAKASSPATKPTAP
jgi:hypothetical protein